MSSNKSGHARAIIELLCKILEENNISFARAETVRQAKFDKCSVTKPMSELLFDVVCLCDNEDKKKLQMGEKMIFLKKKLQAWGYLSESFARLPINFTTGSREILLALGWVLHQHKFVDKIIKRRSSPLSKDFMKFLKSDDVSNCCENLPQACAGDGHLCLKERIQYHMMLTGKLRMSLRRLYSAYQQLTSLTKTILQSTDGVRLQPDLNHLTPLEVHILRHPGSLKRMVQELERDNLELSHLLEWKEKESIFWEWMESVLTAHLESESDKNRASSASSLFDSSLESSVYLPLPPNITEQIHSARDHLRNVILRHESQMSKLEQIVQRKKITSVEAEVHKMQIDKELFGKTLQLKTCGIGEDKNLNNSQEEIYNGEPWSFQSTLPVSERRKVSTPHAAKIASQEELVMSINDELSRLKDKIGKLQTDFHHMQLQYLKELQRVVNLDKTVICIQPRPLKHFYK